MEFRVTQTGAYPRDEVFDNWEDINDELEGTLLDELGVGDSLTITRIS